MKKIIYSDLDGTLLTDWNKGSELSAENKKAIKKWLDHGHYFSVATGRILLNATIFLDDPSIINLPMVCGNGTILYDHHQDFVLKSSLIDRTIFKESLAYDQSKDDLVVIYSDNDFQYVLPLKNKRRVPKLDFPNIEISVEELLTKDIIKLVFVIFEDQHNQILSEIDAFKTRDQFSIIPSSARFIEVVGKNISKGGGIEEALKIKNIDSYKLYCVGDYINDLSMLEVADIGFAPKNAHSTILKHADIIVSDNNNHALKDVIDYLLSEVWDRIFI